MSKKEQKGVYKISEWYYNNLFYNKQEVNYGDILYLNHCDLSEDGYSQESIFLIFKDSESGDLFYCDVVRSNSDSLAQISVIDYKKPFVVDEWLDLDIENGECYFDDFSYALRSNIGAFYSWLIRYSLISNQNKLLNKEK